MKKIIFLSLILGFIFSIFPFSAKGQEALYKNAEIVKKLYVTRPIEIDSAEAWNLILGKIKESKPIKMTSQEEKYMGIKLKQNSWENIYSVDTSGFWIFRSENYHNGRWRINWILVYTIPISFIVLVFIAKKNNWK
jgi:hypothetical protein